MDETPHATDKQDRWHGRAFLSKLIVFSFSIAIGIFYWWLVQDWFVGALATISFWIILGLAAQVRDIWASYQSSGVLTSDERWGWRFAYLWRLAICSIIALYFLIHLFARFHFFSGECVGEPAFYSSHELWHAVLLVSIIAAIAGSLAIGRRNWQRPWSWVIAVYRGFVACVIFLVLMEGLPFVAYLVHITILGILLDQPIQYSTNIAFASSRAGASVLRYFRGRSRLVVRKLHSPVAGFRAVACRVATSNMPDHDAHASVIVMVLLVARIVAVEIPTISPIMADFIVVPTPVRFLAAAILTMFVATTVARRWSEPQAPVFLRSPNGDMTKGDTTTNVLP